MKNGIYFVLPIQTSIGKPYIEVEKAETEISKKIKLNTKERTTNPKLNNSIYNKYDSLYIFRIFNIKPIEGRNSIQITLVYGGKKYKNVKDKVIKLIPPERKAPISFEFAINFKEGKINIYPFDSNVVSLAEEIVYLKEFFQHIKDWYSIGLPYLVIDLVLHVLERIKLNEKIELDVIVFIIKKTYFVNPEYFMKFIETRLNIRNVELESRIKITEIKRASVISRVFVDILQSSRYETSSYFGKFSFAEQITIKNLIEEYFVLHLLLYNNKELVNFLELFNEDDDNNSKRLLSILTDETKFETFNKIEISNDNLSSLIKYCKNENECIRLIKFIKNFEVVTIIFKDNKVLSKIKEIDNKLTKNVYFEFNVQKGNEALLQNIMNICQLMMKNFKHIKVCNKFLQTEIIQLCNLESILKIILNNVNVIDYMEIELTIQQHMEQTIIQVQYNLIELKNILSYCNSIQQHKTNLKLSKINIDNSFMQNIIKKTIEKEISSKTTYDSFQSLINQIKQYSLNKDILNILIECLNIQNINNNIKQFIINELHSKFTNISSNDKYNFYMENREEIITYLIYIVNEWTVKTNVSFWLNWLNEIKPFTKSPLLFKYVLNNQKCFNVINQLINKVYNQSTSIREIEVYLQNYLNDILKIMFQENKTLHLKENEIDLDILNIILKLLGEVTKEKPRKYDPSKNESTDNKAQINQNVKDNINNNQVIQKRKGVGYGCGYANNNNNVQQNKIDALNLETSLKTVNIINILNNIFDTPSLKPNSKLFKTCLESSLLPCIETTFRSGTILNITKDKNLFYSYLTLSITLSKKKAFIPFLLNISKDYKPIQTESIYTLLSILHQRMQVFTNCINKSSSNKQTIEEEISRKTIEAFQLISKNIQQYKIHLNKEDNYSDIFTLPIEKAYPLLMQELTFDYMSMKDLNGLIKHYYANFKGAVLSLTKMIRLAQEYADLTRSLPCESTNSIYVRVDKDNMDYMKVLIIGSEGTPYSNGAFEYDVYFDNNYPNAPPKVNLMTTGKGTVRFNPNLYSNGKVCLSLLGTWSGNSIENWDPKRSTLLQVLISIQSIVMSELVYFNEPSYENQMGTIQGEARNEAYSNIVRYSNIKYAMLEQIKNPSKGFEEVIRHHFYLKKQQILNEVKKWIERSKTVNAIYDSLIKSHNHQLSTMMSQPNKYSQMLNEIYIELEKTLNSLTPPNKLSQKQPNEQIIHNTQNKQQFENLNMIDMNYDNNVIKELNVESDEVKDRYSRYIGVMGMDAVKQQANANIFLSGLNGLGVEIAKNIILSGCKSLVIHDTNNVTYYDLVSQFYLSESDINENRAKACLNKLQQLNYYVKVSYRTENIPLQMKDLDNFGLGNFHVVILTESTNETIIVVDLYCRSKGIKMIVADVYGGFSRVINDFGNGFVINDKDGEELKECMVKYINNITGEVNVLDGFRHEFVDDDQVIVNEVIGMEDKSNKKKNINGQIFKVKVLTPYSFKLYEYQPIYTQYERNGIIKQIKTTSIINYKPLAECLKVNFDNITLVNHLDQNLSISDYNKINHAYVIHLGMWVLNNNYMKLNKKQTWCINTGNDVIKTIETFSKKKLANNEKEILYLLSFTYCIQFPPLCAYIGGIVAQEAIKAITRKFTPINQIMYYDVMEILPKININDISYNVLQFSYQQYDINRTYALQLLLGTDVLHKLQQTKILVVGAGAIGCELLKNIAMLDIGCKDNGAIYITDPDIIETSNLSRQFLFREKHLRLPKSSTAAAAIIQMNPHLKEHIFAKCDKVCEETENFFTDDFFNSLDIVANALDNVNARLYVDSRCVSCRKPLLESGTLGPKGHVQVIIPFKTESYASQSDPDVTTNDIPQCTLKMFPEDAIHCVEWAKDQFGKLFTQTPKIVNKVIEDINDNNFNEIKLIKKAMKYIQNAPITFEECLHIARHKYNKIYVLNIKQLLHLYPLDKKEDNGKLFWTLPKRAPVINVFDYNDEVCQDFISAYSCLLANMYNIKIPYTTPRNRISKVDMCKKVKNIFVKEFEHNVLKEEAIKNEVEYKNDNNQILSNNDNINKLINELKTYIEQYKNKRKGKNISTEVKLISTEFEKDNDLNFHIDLIYAMAALRCRNYKLEIMDWMKVKIKAGRIIPALATTTAAIAGLQTIELIKIVKDIPINSYRNSFLNLAIPLLQMSEPGQYKTLYITQELTTNLWDRWDIVLSNGNQNIKELFKNLKEKYLIYPRDVFQKKKVIYSYLAYKDKKDLNEEILNKSIDKLVGIDKKNTEYVDLIVTFTKNEESLEYLKNVPKVRIYFNNK